MDASLFNVDLLQKICGKIGFTSHKFTKAVCHETIIKAVSDGKLYDSVDPTIDKGGAGQDQTFWEDVLVEFNDYSNSDYGGLVLTSSTDKKIFAEKNVDPSVKCGKNMSWEFLR